MWAYARRRAAGVQVIVVAEGGNTPCAALLRRRRRRRFEFAGCTRNRDLAAAVPAAPSRSSSSVRRSGTRMSEPSVFPAPLPEGAAARCIAEWINAAHIAIGMQSEHLMSVPPGHSGVIAIVELLEMSAQGLQGRSRDLFGIYYKYIY